MVQHLTCNFTVKYCELYGFWKYVYIFFYHYVPPVPTYHLWYWKHCHFGEFLNFFFTVNLTVFFQCSTADVQ